MSSAPPGADERSQPWRDDVERKMVNHRKRHDDVEFAVERPRAHDVEFAILDGESLWRSLARERDHAWRDVYAK